MRHLRILHTASPPFPPRIWISSSQTTLCFQAYYGDRMPEYIHDRQQQNQQQQRQHPSDDGNGVNVARGAAAFWRGAGTNDVARTPAA